MTDTGLYDLDDSRELSNLPLSDDGIFGSERRKIKHLTIYYQTFPSKIGERENLLMQIQRRQCPRKVLITKISLKYQILIMIIQDLIVSKVVWEIETLRKKDSLTTKDKTLDRIVFGYLSSTKIAVHMVQEKAKLLEDDKVRKMLFPKIPIGSRLSHFLKEWEQITQDQWILSIIREGYKLEFLQKPPFLGIKETVVSAKNINIINLEINTLLEKGAI